jgi:PTH2 family peptidyl-tRNA hydrolase
MNALNRLAGGEDELKQVIVVRADLKLSKGKLAAQVAHASVSAAEESPLKREWLRGGQKKVVAKCSDLEELLFLKAVLERKGFPVSLIEDAGLTQVPSGTLTCLGVGPAPAKELDKVTGHLKLL